MKKQRTNAHTRQLPPAAVPENSTDGKTESARRRNQKTRRNAKFLLRKHRAAALGLLTGSFLLAAAAGLLPLLLDAATDRAVQTLPPFVERAAGQAAASDISTLLLRWGRPAGALLLLFLSTLLCAPLRFGREAWFFGGADGRRRSARRILFWLQPRWALKACRFQIALGLRKLLWAAIYFAPGALLLGGTLWQARAGVLELWLFLSAAGGGALLLLLGLGFYLPTVRRYALVPSLLVKQPRCKLRNALRLSAARMDGQSAAFLRFQLGFLPWLALCVFIVPAFFILPWYTQSLACRRRELLSSSLR
ncbi:MAG: hypothetical protein LBC83_06265 [Oscillospiraceae bacterium]|jgi:hypothetical protein|nr:hypothetical protein [Oscillospiraceae bacterium]